MHPPPNADLGHPRGSAESSEAGFMSPDDGASQALPERPAPLFLVPSEFQESLDGGQGGDTVENA